MKQLMILSLFTIFLASAQASTDFLAEKSFPGKFDLTPSKTIAQIVKTEVANKKSRLSEVLAVLEKENCDDDCLSINTKETRMVYTGKSGAQYYGQSYIVPVWASYKGSGLIEEVLGHFLVSFDADMSEGTTVRIKKFIPLSIN